MNRLKSMSKIQKLLVAFFATVLVSFILGFYVRNMIPIAQVNNQYISYGEFTKKLILTNGQSVLEGIVAEKLITQALKDAKVVVTDKEIADKIATMRTELKEKRSSFEALLQSTNQSLPQFQKELRVQLGVEKLLKKNIKVSDKEINDYFKQHNVQKGKGAIYQSQLLAIRDMIYREKLRAAFLNWYQLQKGKAKVNYFL